METTLEYRIKIVDRMTNKVFASPLANYFGNQIYTQRPTDTAIELAARNPKHRIIIERRKVTRGDWEKDDLT